MSHNKKLRVYETTTRAPPCGETATHRAELQTRLGHPSHLSALVPEELSGVLDDLLVGQQAVRLLLAQSEDLPQRDPERPHVARSGELTLQGRQENRQNLKPAG